MDTVNIRPPSDRTYGLEHVAVGADVRVSTLSLVGGECVEWHWHSNTSDIFFCLQGVAVIEMRNPSKLVHVNVGDRYDVMAGVAHRVTPLEGKQCRLVLVQGVGKPDFHRGSHDSH